MVRRLEGTYPQNRRNVYASQGDPNGGLHDRTSLIPTATPTKAIIP